MNGWVFDQPEKVDEKYMEIKYSNTFKMMKAPFILWIKNNFWIIQNLLFITFLLILKVFLKKYLNLLSLENGIIFVVSIEYRLSALLIYCRCNKFEALLIPYNKSEFLEVCGQ